jgi:hypothetical protein
MKSVIFLIFAINICIINAGCVGFTTVPSVMPASVVSLGFEATSTQMLGNQIKFDPFVWTSISTIQVLMESQSLLSNWMNFSCDGYNENISISIFDTNLTLLYYQSNSYVVPWRPEASLNCTGSRWKDVYGNCWSGLAFTINYDIDPPVVFPPEIIYGISYNTWHYGPTPLGLPYPSDSLNVGLTLSPPYIGEDSFPGNTYINSSNPSTYGDGGPLNVFRLTTGIDPYQPTISFLTCDC